MRLIIESDYDKMSDYAAETVIRRINEAAPTERYPFVLGLPTGSTPVGMYRRLVKAYEEGRVSFRHVVTFNMDEYVGLREDHPESYHSFMRRELFDHVDCPAANIHIPDGNAPDLEAECRAYEQAIADAGGIDLFVGGVGSDGHIAFNEPYSSLESRTRVETLTLETIQDNARFFGGDIRQVPRRAITVGVGTIMDAQTVMLLVNGHGKARALRAGVEGPSTQAWPVSALQRHNDALIVCDDAATVELKVGTYRYFKGMYK